MNQSQLYDCTADVLKHRERVQKYLDNFIWQLRGRGDVHDESKLHEPEKSTFDEYRPKLNYLVHGSPEYEVALSEMGLGLDHHYAENRHHPQHYPDGVNGMTLVDLVEMFCDWCAAAEEKRLPVDLAYSAKRFSIAPQLVQIFYNTLKQIDMVNGINGVPLADLAPEKLGGD